jgi:hypothetical protein
MKCLKNFFMLFALLLLPLQSWAAHPLITDDAWTQGKGKFQLELNGQYDYDKQTENGVTGKTTGGEAATIVSYGIVDAVDLVLSLPYQWVAVKQDGSAVFNEHGIGDMGFEAKWRFFEKEGISIAFKPGISFPTGDDKKGLGAGKIGYSTFLILSAEAKPWAFHFNAGYRRSENTVDVDEKTDIWHASLAATYEVIKDLQAVGNIGIETNTDKSSGSAPAFALAGVIYGVNENFDLDFGVKAGLNEPETDYSILAGTTFRF